MHLYLTSKFNFVAKPILAQLKKEGIKKILVIPTAAEPEKGDLSWLEDDKRVFTHAGFEVKEFSITNKARKEVEDALADSDAIFVTGGNCFYLLQELKRKGVDLAFLEAIRQGKPYIGSSAGSVIMGESVEIVKGADKEEEAPDLNSYDGLKLVDLSILPHWGSIKEGRRERKIKALAEFYDANLKILLLRDNQYIRVEGKVWSVKDI